MNQADGLTVDGTPAADYMAPEELRDLVRRGHVVGCHTHSHVRLADTLTLKQYEDEIVGARARLAEILGAEVDTFCWVGGEEWAYSSTAQRLIEAEGFSYSFMTNLQTINSETHPLWLQRTNIEASWPMRQVRTYLSGIMDLAYRGKRNRIEQRLSA